MSLTCDFFAMLLKQGQTLDVQSVSLFWSHTDLYHFKDTEFDGDVTEWVEDQGALSISGGLNSPWKVNLDRLKEFVDTPN